MAKNNAARTELRSFASEMSTALKEPTRPNWEPLADAPVKTDTKEVKTPPNVPSF